MVFESVVADVLNRFLGDYVENLDGSQLKLGIWGGEWLSVMFQHLGTFLPPFLPPESSLRIQRPLLAGSLAVTICFVEYTQCVTCLSVSH